VSYIAIVQKENYNYYQEAAIASYSTTYNNNANVGFSLTCNADVILCSAQKSNWAYAAAGRNNSSTGFTLGLVDSFSYYGTNSVWTSWIAFGFK
jgi:hypothetical protein